MAQLRPRKFRPGDAAVGEFVNVVNDETTAAGILSSLKSGCTRLLAPDEGDEVFRDLGLVQSYSQSGRVQAGATNARSKLTSLYDRPNEFVRSLKGQELKVEQHAKLNILVGLLIRDVRKCFIFRLLVLGISLCRHLRDAWLMNYTTLSSSVLLFGHWVGH